MILLVNRCQFNLNDLDIHKNKNFVHCNVNLHEGIPTQNSDDNTFIHL